MRGPKTEANFLAVIMRTCTERTPQFIETASLYELEYTPTN